MEAEGPSERSTADAVASLLIRTSKAALRTGFAALDVRFGRKANDPEARLGGAIWWRSTGVSRRIGNPISVESSATIEGTIRYIALRHRLSGPEVENVASEVRLAPIERNYAALRRFQGRSSFKVYVITVIQRLFLDYCRK
jgi:hypothetical protein